LHDLFYVIILLWSFGWCIGTADVAGALAGGLVVPLGYGGSVVCLPPLVRTLNTYSGLVATGATANNFDNFDSSLALKIA
jgi:hypothetical protein